MEKAPLYKQSRVYENPDQALAALKILLEKEQPKKFNLRWIAAHNLQLCNYIKNHQFEIKNGKKDYTSFISSLGNNWINQWSHKKPRGKIEKNRTINSSLKEVLAALEKEQPKTFNPFWISQHTSARTFLEEALKQPNGSIDWNSFVSQLPPVWQEKWTYDKPCPIEPDELVEKLTQLLQTKNPKTFNRQWLLENAPDIHTSIRRYVLNPTTKKPDWDRIIQKLPENLRSKWIEGIREEKKTEISQRSRLHSFESAVAKLNQFLKDQQPRQVSSKLIELALPDVFNYFESYERDPQGGIHWKKILPHIDPEYQPKFIFPKRLRDFIPDQHYESQKELSSVLEKYKDKLYTFFVANDNDDKIKREEICKALISLVKKGNSLAKEKLLQFLEITTNEWIDYLTDFSCYKYYPDLLKEKIEKCIYYYDINSAETSFIGYLHASLKKEAEKLTQKTRIIELDRTYNNSRTARGETFKKN